MFGGSITVLIVDKLLNFIHRRKRQPLPTVRSLDEVQAALKQVTYRKDCFDWTQAPELTWGRKQGDCEDFAVLSQALLKQIGIDSVILKVYTDPLKYSHAVCVFDGGYFSNEHFRPGVFSLDEIAKRVAGRRLHFWRIIDET